MTRTNALNSALDEVYIYDGLNRLIDTNRNGADLQAWSLDSLGNWRSFTDGAATQTRTNNTANEITGISGVSWIEPVYDAAGNMISGPKPGDESTRLHFKYDAWNRLVEVLNDNAGTPGTTVARYEYDGRNYRVQKLVGSDTFDVYYNEAWQVLEVRKNGDTDSLEQNIWDPRYVDAAGVRFYDGNTDGDYADTEDNTLYYTQDANFNVTALVDAATGNVVERYSYDPYGKATVYDASWTVRPTGTAYSNELQYTSYRLDAETGLYQVRNRFYHTALGTWISGLTKWDGKGCWHLK